VSGCSRTLSRSSTLWLAESGVRLDHVEDAPGGVVFDRQHLLALLVGVPVHLNGDTRILSLEPNPGPLAAPFFGIVGHVFVLLKDRTDAIGSNREVVRILSVGLATGGFQLWNLAIVAVLFGELLDSSAADLEVLSDQGSIHVVINNALTDLDNIVPVKLHFTGRLVGQIMPTKSLAYTTEKVMATQPIRAYALRCWYPHIHDDRSSTKVRPTAFPVGQQNVSENY